MGKFHADLEAHLNFSKFCEPAKCSVIFIQSLAYLTPIVFLILPRIQGTTTPPIKENEKTNQCDIGCEGEIFFQHIQGVARNIRYKCKNPIFRWAYIFGSAPWNFIGCLVGSILAK